MTFLREIDRWELSDIILAATRAEPATRSAALARDLLDGIDRHPARPCFHRETNPEGDRFHDAQLSTIESEVRFAIRSIDLHRQRFEPFEDVGES